MRNEKVERRNEKGEMRKEKGEMRKLRVSERRGFIHAHIERNQFQRSQIRKL